MGQHCQFHEHYSFHKIVAFLTRRKFHRSSCSCWFYVDFGAQELREKRRSPAWRQGRWTSRYRCFEFSKICISSLRRRCRSRYQVGNRVLLHTYTWARSNTQTHTHTLTHTHIYTHTYTRTHIYTHKNQLTYNNKHTHIYTNTCTQTHTYTHIYKCKHTHTHTHSYTHAHIHTHTHTI